MTDFWTQSGHRLLERRADGHLVPTEDFLRAYLLRPEIAPVDESCAAERALHRALLENPREAVAATRLSKLHDSDARENYGVLLAFRDRLLRHETLEDAYLSLFIEPAGVATPPLFIDQLVQLILRSILDGLERPLWARAAEMLFRPQKVTINDGHIMAADEETVETFATTGGFGELGRLIQESRTPLRTVQLDVLGEENEELYWTRDEAFDTVLNLNFAGPGLDALCRVLEHWVKHFLDVGVSIQPVQQISDERWVWHIGLDVEASRLLNDLYEGVEVGELRLARLLSLFRMEISDTSIALPQVAGRPIYLAMCMNEKQVLRLKPQNLLVNMPLTARA